MVINIVLKFENIWVMQT